MFKNELNNNYIIQLFYFFLTLFRLGFFGVPGPGRGGGGGGGFKSPSSINPKVIDAIVMKLGG